MNKSIVIGKDVDAKKGFSSARRNDKSIQRIRDERERQLDSLGGVIGNIGRDGTALSAESIATELGGRSAAERTPALLALQQTHGNRYVQRVVAGIQAKLVVGQPGDIYEQEADRVADEVMRMPEPGVQRQVEPEDEEEEEIQAKPLAEEITQRVQRQVEPEEEEEEEIQTKQLPSQTPEIVPGVETSINSIRGGGQPLPDSTRAFFEPRFGCDFSRVRVHTDANAADTARAVNARAFTRGHDVVFGAGQYAPGTTAGQRLLAHELTHVIQQGRAPPSSQGICEQHQSSTYGSFVSREPSSRYLDTIRRVVWYPHRDTGRDSRPWGTGPSGDILEAATDAGTSINTWRPHDRATYWCHGYTFGGSTARGGPYSIGGQTVPTVLRDDGWRRVHSCVATVGDILVFYSGGTVMHSGIVRGSVSAPGGRVDEANSGLYSKWGQAGGNSSSWLTNANNYGKYKCFSKTPAYGPCSGYGTNELP